MLLATFARGCGEDSRQKKLSVVDMDLVWVYADDRACGWVRKDRTGAETVEGLNSLPYCACHSLILKANWPRWTTS